MTSLITQPGIYSAAQISNEQYHADPCPTPSLSSSGARTLISECPAIFWEYRNDPEPPSEALKIGSAAHEWILEGDQWPARHGVLSEDCNLRTKAGKEERDAIESDGRRAIKFEDFQAIKAMRDAIAAHPTAGALFTNGLAEPTIAWKDDETGVWLRCRPDFLPHAARFIPDYKTAVDGSPAGFAKAVANHGYHAQAAWYLEGIEAVHGTRPDRFLFVVQEKRRPYLVTVIDLNDEDLERGVLENRLAIRIFADCLERDRWPGYSDDVVKVDMPYWARNQHDEKKQAGVFDPPEFRNEEQAA